MTCQFVSSECRGRLEWHHCVSKSRLKREFKYGAVRRATHGVQNVWRPGPRGGIIDGSIETLSVREILGDTRNRVFLCSHHHELVTNGRLKVELPDSVWEFAAEFGLEGMLENDLRRAA